MWDRPDVRVKQKKTKCVPFIYGFPNCIAYIDCNLGMLLVRKKRLKRPLLSSSMMLRMLSILPTPML